MHRSDLRWVAGAALAALLMAACGSSSKPAAPSTPAPAETTTTNAHAVGPSVSMATTSLGKVLVDRAGHTLYLYDKDTPGVSKCTAVCASAWPPATTVGAPTFGTGLSPSMFTTITRTDGTKQLAFNGLPLYTYTGDSKAGDTAGQGLGDFFAAGSNGQMIGHAS